VSTADDPEKKRPAQPTVAWNSEDIPQGPRPTIPWSAEELARMASEEAAAEEAKTRDDPLVGTLLRNKWRVLQRLGAGSFGTVYKVQDVKGGWVEALKILGVDRLTGAEAEEMRARFLREAQIMKRLGTRLAHIVGLSTYEEDIEAGLIYFLMELVEGRSLAGSLSEEGPSRAVERVIRIALQVCDALMAAHEGPEPVVHRDLKLENLMLTTDRSGRGRSRCSTSGSRRSPSARRTAAHDRRDARHAGLRGPGAASRRKPWTAAPTSSPSASSSTRYSPGATRGSATSHTSRRTRSTSSWWPPTAPRCGRWGGRG
jgi:serine/threonine protein kinase